MLKQTSEEYAISNEELKTAILNHLKVTLTPEQHVEFFLEGKGMRFFVVTDHIKKADNPGTVEQAK